jgi:hypothetical protein
MIAKAGTSYNITIQLCHPMLRGESVPLELDIRSHQGVYQHVKAAPYIINEPCILEKDLSVERTAPLPSS